MFGKVILFREHIRLLKWSRQNIGPICFKFRIICSCIVAPCIGVNIIYVGISSCTYFLRNCTTMAKFRVLHFLKNIFLLQYLMWHALILHKRIVCTIKRISLCIVVFTSLSSKVCYLYALYYKCGWQFILNVKHN